jgi:hypothetical protein
LDLAYDAAHALANLVLSLIEAATSVEAAVVKLSNR